MTRKVWLAGLATLFAPLLAHAVEIYTDFPKEIHPNERYVFYSHGKIVEGTNEKPVSPEFGEYDFPAIRKALFEGGGHNLIAYHRPNDVELTASADQLAAWVRKLIEAGVKPSRITLVGFSRGSYITAVAASALGDRGFSTVLMGSCLKGDVPVNPPVTLLGPLLNVYETSDVVGPCPELVKRSHPKSFEEIVISTGKKHGAFYLPRDDWMKPLKAWIARTNR